MRSLLFAFLIVAATAIAACSSSSIGPFIGTKPTVAPSAATGTVAFSFVVPTPTPAPALRRRTITLPSNAQSVEIVLDSVNGSPAPSSSPTIANLTPSTSGCTSTTQLTCNVNVTAPVGTLVFTVKVFTSTGGGTAPSAEGNLSVTTTGGSSVNAPTTLSGTVSSIVITMGGSAELGTTAQIPVVIQGEDANGRTIIGTYTNAITLSDSDASAQTSLSATNVPDSTTAAGISLNYLGGAMSAAATIGASASGVSNVTQATFTPDTNRPLAVSSATYNYTETYSYGLVGSPTNGPYTSSGSYTASITSPLPSPSASPFEGVSNLFSMSDETGQESDSGYYTWTTAGGTQLLSYLGYYNQYSTNQYGEYYCSPGYVAFEVPIPANWSGYPSGGSCTYSYQDNTASTDPTDYYVENTAANNNGSYTYTNSYVNPSGAGVANWQIDSAGDITISNNDPAHENADASFTLSAQAPTSNTSTVTASYVLATTGSLPSPLPSPTTTTAPNPWSVIPQANGVPPNPLQSDIYTNAGTVAATTLPSTCQVTAGIIPTGGSLTEITEAWYYSDPADWNEDNYYGGTTNYYYLAGVGAVCVVDAYTYYYFDDAVIDWYDGNDQSMEMGNETETSYITSTTLTAMLAHSRSMTEAESRAAGLLAIASRQHRAAEMRQRIAAHRHQMHVRSMAPLK